MSCDVVGRCCFVGKSTTRVGSPSPTSVNGSRYAFKTVGMNEVFQLLVALNEAELTVFDHVEASVDGQLFFKGAALLAVSPPTFRRRVAALGSQSR